MFSCFLHPNQQQSKDGWWWGWSIKYFIFLLDSYNVSDISQAIKDHYRWTQPLIFRGKIKEEVHLLFPPSETTARGAPSLSPLVATKINNSRTAVSEGNRSSPNRKGSNQAIKSKNQGTLSTSWWVWIKKGSKKSSRWPLRLCTTLWGAKDSFRGWGPLPNQVNNLSCKGQKLKITIAQPIRPSL